jgi:hypothetical protein
MNCKEIETILFENYHGDYPSHVWKHLECCQNCEKTYQSIGKLENSFRNAARTEKKSKSPLFFVLAGAMTAFLVFLGTPEAPVTIMDSETDTYGVAFSLIQEQKLQSNWDALNQTNTQNQAPLLAYIPEVDTADTTMSADEVYEYSVDLLYETAHKEQYETFVDLINSQNDEQQL